MPRNSDMVRAGASALPENKTPEANTSEENKPQEGLFSGVPNITQPPQRQINNFPMFSGLYNEIGTIAEVIDQINRISDFVSGRPIQPPREHQQQHR